jgi:acyl transferase domain-containing protein
MHGAADIAIVGMAGRFPGARSVDEFWRSLTSATESITLASDDELRQAGIASDALSDPGYVRARGRLKDVEWFDAEFFGFSSREAEITDPQHRLFMEVAWEALEDAGHAGSSRPGRVGVYAGSSLSSYLVYHLIPTPGLLRSVGEFEILTANDKDYLATRVSYKLDLRGPSVTVQTACSTSLVAVHLACQSLIGGECDLALAGGVTVVVPQESGYTFRPGGILSPDGHCRAFDQAAAGTVFANGLGVVVLRRLEDAIESRDSVLAVIKGSSINNDGAEKVGYTAPSVHGQAVVVSEALGIARVHPATIGYVEAHGTGTSLGDPIEIAALSSVFAPAGVRAGSCPIGSVKTNVGHLDAAAGVAGLIKVVSALEAKAIPATLHFQAFNPAIDGATNPFFVNTAVLPWPSAEHPRRASVSSFGIGGTNAHVVLEEAPPPPESSSSREWQLILLSARDAQAVDEAAARLRQSLSERPGNALPDIAFTLQTGRRRFSHRRALLARDGLTLADLLSSRDTAGVHVEERDDRQIAFMFPGQGTQYPGMAQGLYAAEAIFREHVDRCAQLLGPLLGADIRAVMFNRDGDAVVRLNRTEFAQPALFVVGYALAQLWRSWGIRPSAMIGHSLGEYLAACVAGVFRLEDALRIVVGRAQLMQAMPTGAMLAVAMTSNDLQQRLPESLAIAAINSATLSVVSGATDDVAAFEQSLMIEGVATQRLRAGHAFHSALMDDATEPLAALVETAERRPPTTPFVSNVTGTWISDADAVDPQYWARHLRQTVRFDHGLSALCALPDVLLLELGPGRTLVDFARNVPAGREVAAFPSLDRDGGAPDQRVLVDALGQLWLAGARIDWSGFYAREQRRRVRLPSYPFQRKRYWVDLPKAWREGNQALTGAAAESLDVGRPEKTSVYERPILRTPLVEAETDLERAICGLWEELLGTAPIGIDDSFFELGGNSLLVTRLATRLREMFPVDVPLADLFETTTIRALARLVEARLVDKVERLSEDEAAQLLAMIGAEQQRL